MTVATRHKYRFSDRITAERKWADAEHLAMVYQRAIRAMHSGMSETIPFGYQSRDNETWTVSLVQYTTPAGNPESIVLYNFGGSSDTVGLTDEFLRVADAEVANIGRDYDAFDYFRRMIRAARRS